MLDYVLKNSVGNMMENEEEDVSWVKSMLHSLGFRKNAPQNGIIEQETDDAIREFQKAKGLKVDGYLMPGGETEKAIRESQRSQPFVKEWDLPDGPLQREVIIQNPIKAMKAYLIKNAVDKDLADKYPNVRIPHNNEADAVRHALWSYRVTKALGEQIARDFGNAHERTNKSQGQDEEEEKMDGHNNAMGIKLALDPLNKDKNDLEVVMDAAKRGWLITKPKISDPNDRFRGSRRLGLTTTRRAYLGDQ